VESKTGSSGSGSNGGFPIANQRVDLQIDKLDELLLDDEEPVQHHASPPPPPPPPPPQQQQQQQQQQQHRTREGQHQQNDVGIVDDARPDFESRSRSSCTIAAQYPLLDGALDSRCHSLR
jgi:hypothetical protein